MNTFEKAELTASTRSIERFSKSGITIYNSEVLDMAGNKNKEKKNTNNCKELKKCYSLCKWRLSKLREGSLYLVIE